MVAGSKKLSLLFFLHLLVALMTTTFMFSVSSSMASHFGSSGSDGRNGHSGFHGQNGTDQTLFADGRPLSLELSGTHGEPGDDGHHGEDASSCYFYGEPHHNVYGASGGDGGDGGHGGDGGRGGNVTVYYKNLSDLKSIQVISRGGQGAPGGRGGYGGQGCHCPRYSWSVRICNNTSGYHPRTFNLNSSDLSLHTPARVDYNPRPGHRPPGNNSPGHSAPECHYETYYCHSGSSGSHGRHGSHGQRGNWGLLTLIKRDTILPPQNPYGQSRLVDMPDKVLSLSLHQWISHPQGARTLLAPGSELQDNYVEYDKTLKRQFVLRWEAPRPVEQFEQNLNFQIADKEVLVTYPQDWWIDVDKKTQDSLTTHVIKGLVTEKEAENVGFGELKGSKRDLVLEVEDRAGLADTIKTTFRITYERKQMLWYKKVYTGDIPAELVTRKGNNIFEIAIGKLPIHTNYMLRGKKIKIILTIHRSFAGRETKWAVSKKYKI